MAQIVEEHVLIRISRIVKDDSDKIEKSVTDDLLNMIEQVVAEVIDTGSVVEVDAIEH